MKYLDSDGLTYLWQVITNRLSAKVDKVDGKGLSTNDYTSTEKTKLANIEAGAQVNVLEGIQKNGTTVTITNKIANIEVPTKTSDLTNDSNFAVDSSYVHTDNNYTSTEKTKLANIEAGAEVNVIETVKLNGTALTVSNKAVNVTVPTKTSDLTNDSDYITSSDISGKADSSTTLAGYGITNAYTKTETQSYVTGLGYQTASDVSSAISSALTSVMDYKGTVATVSSLPASGNKNGDVYHVTATAGEYAWDGTEWQELGSTIDLSGYVQTTDLIAITNAEIDTIVAS